VVQISQDEINRDMDSYLSSKSRSEHKPAKRKLDDKPVEAALEEGSVMTEEDIEFDSIKEPWYHRVIDFFIGRPKALKVAEDSQDAEEPAVTEDSVADDAEGVEMEKKQSIFSKISSWFGGGEAEETDFRDVEKGPAEASEPAKEQIDPEIKKLLKIQHKWMEKLPPEVIAEFKDTPEYAEYKMLLEKYHLIKKAEPEKKE
jgi:hypothetical protein